MNENNVRRSLSRGAQFLVIALVGCASPQPAAPPPPQPQPQPQPQPDAPGVIRVPEFRIPLSRYMSPEARRLYTDPPASTAKVLNWQTATIEEVRASHDEFLGPILARIRADYPVEIADRAIAGVATRVITPTQAVTARNRHRVLLNLHGGGFFMGANAEALVESIPVAAVAGIPVITIDYRQGPEHRFPAATDDVIAVYRELLGTYPAGNVGIYGCSAGGSLAAMTVAALQKTDLPAPGAIGIFSAGAYAHFSGDPMAKGTWGGDSRFWAPPVLGQPALGLKQPPFSAATAEKSVTTAYISNVDPADPVVSPAESPELLARFPPTLVLTGTRAYDMSAVVETHRQLVRAGAQAELHLWDGLGHCFFFESHLPESKEAYDVMAKFFDKHLGTGNRP